jgi:hypothetical protein
VRADLRRGGGVIVCEIRHDERVLIVVTGTPNVRASDDVYGDGGWGSGRRGHVARVVRGQAMLRAARMLFTGRRGADP